MLLVLLRAAVAVCTGRIAARKGMELVVVADLVR